MKKILVTGILGIAAITSVRAQGVVVLYNYAQPNIITYGASTGQSGGLVNGTLGNWTVAIYGVAGSQAATVNTALAGDGGFGTVAGMGGLTLGTGTATLIEGYPGQFGVSDPATVASFGFAGTGTFVLVAYNGASYDTSVIRGHSTAFVMDAKANPDSPVDVGPFFSTFSVHAVPEPSTFALAGLGLAGLLIFRRRK